MKKSPVLLKPVLKSQLWGGDMLHDQFGKGAPGQRIGESWELSAHQNGSSVVASGEYTGIEFSKYLDMVLKGRFDRFPLLVKLIGPAMDLSVQVHPSDGYSGLLEGESGKSEAWYIVAAPENGRIICGLNCGREEFAKALDEGNVEPCLNFLPVAAGDIVEIKPGLVHALCAGVTVYEVQQNSDVTYRLYDWGRVDAATGKPRQLHTQKAMDVIDFDSKGVAEKILQDTDRQLCIHNDKFMLESIWVDGVFVDAGDDFGAYTVIAGEGSVTEDNKLLFELKDGDTFFAPVCKGWKVQGHLHILKAGCPGK